ncbi:hypothetical protein BJX65DRAFT_311774 [Aspergillus insuetus]
MGRHSKAKQLKEQETANQERPVHSDKVQQLAKLRSGPHTICDCPSHASYRMWCPTGDITIPKNTLFPMSSTNEGAPEENHNPFSLRSQSERQDSGQTPIKREIPADWKGPSEDLDAASAPKKTLRRAQTATGSRPKIGKVFKEEKVEQKVLKRERVT